MIEKVKWLHVVWLFMSMIFAQNVVAQTRTVKGVVCDDNQEPMAGVTVVVPGTSVGTSTAVNGTFTIKVPAGAKVLDFTFIGYKRKRISLNRELPSTLKVVMQEDATQLDEVVAIGYGTQRKADITGAVASVSSDVTEKRVVTNMMDALQGKIGGVRISSSEGGPMGGFDINIRGNTSLSGNSEPLWIIDGLPGNSESVNPNDVESIDILKDASSTAIYGARGANGVIIVTTKQGKKNSTSVDFSATVGVQSSSKKLDLLDSYNFAKQKYFQQFTYQKYTPGLYESLGYTGLDLFIDPEGNIYQKGNGTYYAFDNFERYAANDAVNTDWQDEMLSSALLQDYRLTVRGGGARNTYSVMLYYLNNEGILRNTNSETYSGRLNFNQEIGKYVRFKTNTSFVRKFNNGISGNIQQMLTLAPTKPADYDPSDDQFLLPNEVPGRVVNPIQQADLIVDKTSTYNFMTNNNIDIKINKHLSGTITLGYTKSGSLRDEYYPSNVQQGWDYNGRAIKTINESEKIFNENVVRYDNKWGKHKLGAVIGNTLDRSWSKMVKIENRNFGLENLKEEGLGKGTEPQIPTSTYVQSSLASFYGRITYDWADKYLFKATMRADGASNFSKNNKWGYFPSAAFAWRINQEEWLKHVKVISNMKLRLSWGESGKRAIGNYTTLANIGTGFYTGNGENLEMISYRQNLPNDNLKWETTSEVNIGYDMGVLNNRVMVTFDFYRRKTRDLLYSVPVATYSGFGSQIQNLGEIQNQGMELAFSANIIKKRNVNWTFDFNISKNKSKLIEIGERGWEINTVGAGNYYLKEGLPLANWYGYQTQGIWQTQAELDAALASFNEHVASGIGPQAGDLSKAQYDRLKPGYRKIKDQPNAEGKYDGIINADDRVILGQGEPNFVGGFSTSFRYKWLTLDVAFTYNVGNKIYNKAGRILETDISQRNQFAATANRWFPTLYHYDPNSPDHRGELLWEGNPTNDILSCMHGQGNDDTIYDIYLEDGSFLRLSDITLSFNLPKKWLKKAMMKSATVFVTGKNLFVWSDYKGYDPEVNMSTGAAKYLCPGLDNWAYPKSRIISGGIKLSF